MVEGSEMSKGQMIEAQGKKVQRDMHAYWKEYFFSFFTPLEELLPVCQKTFKDRNRDAVG